MEEIMRLELIGRPVPDRHGFLLHATDSHPTERQVSFLLPEEVAVKVLGFDPACGDLLERAVLDRLPEVWDACLHAYRSVARIEADLSRPVVLIEPDFLPH
jgi:hypothetical protein